MMLFYKNYMPNVIQLISVVVLLVSGSAAEITRMLIADEGHEAVHYVNLNNPSKNWTTRKDNRDMQLIGNNQMLVSIRSGYYVLDIATGDVVHEKGGYSGVESARRLPNGHTRGHQLAEPRRGHGGEGRQVIEYDSEGELVWAWHQDPGIVKMNDEKQVDRVPFQIR